MNAPITAIYASLLAVHIIILSLRVSLKRRKTRIGLGDEENEDLQRIVRTQANTVEYVPMALLLLLLLELNGIAAWVLHAAGVTLFVSRLLHMAGLRKSSGYSFGRYWGTLITWLLIVGMALLNVL
ncbi:MAG: MAPEG family protein, partial [Gammaproteobacteria bacterium]|nr:MAPEG family protein [Gammaproteobacteria bacterium]